MKTSATLQIDRELDKFEGVIGNVTELEVYRQNLHFLYMAIAVRNLELDLLEHQADGWFYCDRFLGVTVNDAYWEIIKWW